MTIMTNSTSPTRKDPEPSSKSWSLADAKAHLSEVLDQALTRGPQVITRRGRKAVVVVAAEEWERKVARRGTLAEFFAASPLPDSGLELERPTDGPSELDL
jgi:prevent-host-death family protein